MASLTSTAFLIYTASMASVACGRHDLAVQRVRAAGRTVRGARRQLICGEWAMTAIDPGTGATADALSERLFDAVLGAMDMWSVYVGDKLGLYTALAGSGPLTAAELTGATGMHPAARRSGSSSRRSPVSWRSLGSAERRLAARTRRGPDRPRQPCLPHAVW